MKHTENLASRRVVELHTRRLQKQQVVARQASEVLQEYAAVMCARLASIYGGESFLTSMEPCSEPGWWVIRISVTWANTSITRGVRLKLDAAGVRILDSVLVEVEAV